MEHRANPRFWDCYHQLPEEVRQLADKCYSLLREDSQHPSVRLKKVGKLWSARVGMHHRSLAAEHEGQLVWFWIGPHSEYDQLLGRR